MFDPLRKDEITAAANGGAIEFQDEWASVTPVPADAPETPFNRNKLGKPSDCHTYRDAQGAMLGYVLRFDGPDGAKEFRPLTFCQHADGRREWRWKTWPTPRPLYGLDRLAAKPDALVVVCEGEKAADAAETLWPNVVAVTSPGGSKAANKADWDSLKGRTVVIWPDADEPGHAYAYDVAKLALSAGAAEVRMVQVPTDLPSGWDLADFLAEDKHGLPIDLPPFSDDELRALLDDALPVELPRQEVGAAPDADPERVLSVSSVRPWGELRQLPPLLPRAPSMTEDLLPESLRPWIVDISERLQVPLENIAIPAMIAVAGVVGRACGIYPKQHDTWLVIPNLWGGLITRTGFLKTACLTEAFKPIHVLIDQAREEFSEQDAVAEADKAILKAQISAATDRAKSDAKANKDLTGVKNDLIDLQKELDDSEVHERRYITNDGTVEKIGEILVQNPRGIIQVRDELTGFLRNMDKAGREGDREFFLEAWNGNGSFQIDRISRGSIFIKGMCLSIVGGIQPHKMKVFVNAALGGEGGDGLLQRFQLLVWPEMDARWVDVDRSPNLDAREHVTNIFKKLDLLSATQLGFDPEHYDGVPALHFTPEAQALFNKWRAELESRIRSPALENAPAYEGHLAKYRSLMPSLALLFHLVDHAFDDVIVDVSLEPARMAASWVEFLDGHAKKIYASELSRNLAAAHNLAEHIKGGDLEDGVPSRDIYRKHWSGLNDVETLWSGLHELEKYGAVQIVEVSDTGGRPTDAIHFHPDLLRTAA